MEWIPAAAAVSSAALAVWLYLWTARGHFWLGEPGRTAASVSGPVSEWPAVLVVVPARNEAEMLPHTLPSLLQQEYPGPLRIILVDDRSEDGTGQAALAIAAAHRASDRLAVVRGSRLPSGWTGKLWALEQGIRAGIDPDCDFLLFTDADICHPPDSVAGLVSRATGGKLDLLSLMVRLRTEGFWEKLLIPAFVFFFVKLYPLPWVAAPDRRTAAAAGGCLLLRRRALERTGGLRRLRGALIDDCALARQIKAGAGGKAGRIRLELSDDLQSLRQYQGLAGIREMVSRTAYTQLRHSPALLVATVIGMFICYLGPPLGSGAGLAAAVQGHGFAIWPAVSGLAGWGLMAGLFLPMLRRYQVKAGYAILLPVAGLLYTLMTIDSGWNHHLGRGGRWKGRVQGHAPAARH